MESDLFSCSMDLGLFAKAYLIKDLVLSRDSIPFYAFLAMKYNIIAGGLNFIKMHKARCLIAIYLCEIINN